MKKKLNEEELVLIIGKLINWACEVNGQQGVNDAMNAAELTKDEMIELGLEDYIEEGPYQVQFVDEYDEIYDGGKFDTLEDAKQEAIDGYYIEYVGFVIYNCDGDIIYSDEDLEEEINE